MNIDLKEYSALIIRKIVYNNFVLRDDSLLQVVTYPDKL